MRSGLHNIEAGFISGRAGSLHTIEQGFVRAADVGGVVSAVDITFVDSDASSADSNSYSFASQSLGDAASDRVIIIGANGGTGSDITITSVTLDGNAATEIIKQGSTSVRGTAGLFAIAWPAGTTGTIVVNWNGTSVGCGLVVYRMTGTGGSITAHDTGADGDTSNPLSDTLNIPANGGAAAIACVTAAVTQTWAGLTEDVDAVVDPTFSVRYSAAHANFEAEQTGLTVSTTFSGAPNFQALVMASWGPA